MEFESMDNCFPTAQDDSATTCNGPSTHGPMARTQWSREPCGSCLRSIVTASIAAITVPFQSPRFGTISALCGRLLRKFLSGSVTLSVVAATTGAIAWSGHLETIPLSLVAPLLAYRTNSRAHAYASMLSYYAAASWPLIPGGRGKAALSVPVCLLLTAIPPLGIIGWASPILSAGVLFPGSKWIGLGLIIGFLSLFRFKPAASVVCLTFCALVFHFQYRQPQIPAGWEAVDTNFGGAGQGDPDFATEFNTHQSMQTTIIESHAAVVLFPEHLVQHWNESTEAFWENTLTSLSGQHRTVLIGAGIDLPVTPRNAFGQSRYLNVLFARGEENIALY